MRPALDRQLRALHDDITLIGGMVEDAVGLGVQALVQHDANLARTVVARDREINRLRYEVEHKCLYLIATQQPLATDLREIAAMLSIVTDLERMGDHAAGNAEIALRSIEAGPAPVPATIQRMSALCQTLLHRTMQAMAARDEAACRQIWAEDDEVDAAYRSVVDELIQAMEQRAMPIIQGTYYVWAAHNLERISDRVTNITERIIFAITGVMRGSSGA